MATITSLVNGQVYIEILNTFLILLMEHSFHYEVIFQDNNASCQRVKNIKDFQHTDMISQQTVWIYNMVEN